MESQKRRKRKRILRPPSFSSFLLSRFRCYSRWWALLFFSFFAFFFLFGGGSNVFRPVLIICRFSSVSATSNSGQGSGSELLKLRVEDRVLFPDHVLLLFSKISIPSSSDQSRVGALYCVYREEWSNSSDRTRETRNLVILPVLSLDDYDESCSMARCPLPLANYSAVVNLRTEQDRDDGMLMVEKSIHSWETLVYGAALDGETVVVFVKGLNLRPDRVSDPTQFSCHFSWGDSERNDRFTLTTMAVTAAQEVVRCSMPLSLQNYPAKVHRVQVSIGVASHPNPRAALGGGGVAATLHSPFPSVAKFFHSNSEEKYNKKYELCVCTMVWNQAASLREWIVYHAWLGVERWFIYDNNSEDGIKEVIDELEQENYNVSRHVWPWIKTQEAGFSHCILKARDECKWVAFTDVDEFFYFPPSSPRHPKTSELGYPSRHSLRALVANFSSSTTIGEIRMACHSFGPSGLSTHPSQGVTMGYTCRLQSPERHKSIVRPDAVDETLLNVVHHFHLRTGYRYLNLPQSTAVINHYKYQVWEAFRAKFFRRVATYVADWQENQNEGSKDRAPGLGTDAIEPPNWPLRFCEVWDTGLRDFIMAKLADPASRMLPWERPLL